MEYVLKKKHTGRGRCINVFGDGDQVDPPRFQLLGGFDQLFEASA